MDFAVTRLQATCGPGRRYPGDPNVFGLPTREFAELVADQVFCDPDDAAIAREYNVITQFAQVDDVGIVLLVQMVKQSDGTPLDISGASVLDIIIGYPGGAREIKSGTLYTDGLDGKMYYVVEEDILPIKGDYFVQGYVEIGSKKFYSEVGTFEVNENIQPGSGPTPPDPHVGTFINSDLVDGVLTLTHDEGLSPPYTIDVTIFNNLGQEITPDSITGHANSVDINLASFIPLTGTWGYVYT